MYVQYECTRSTNVLTIQIPMHYRYTNSTYIHVMLTYMYYECTRSKNIVGRQTPPTPNTGTLISCIKCGIECRMVLRTNACCKLWRRVRQCYCNHWSSFNPAKTRTAAPPKVRSFCDVRKYALLQVRWRGKAGNLHRSQDYCCHVAPKHHTAEHEHPKQIKSTQKLNTVHTLPSFPRN